VTVAAEGLEEFKQVLRNFRELGGLAVKGTVAVPLLNVWLKFGPPPTAAIAVLTSGVQFLAVMWAFHFWHDMERKNLDRRMRICVGLLITALIVFGVLMKQFTTRPRPNAELVVEGYALRGDVEPLIGPGYTSANALHDAQYEPSQVWTATSITLIHTFFVVSWLSAFATVALFLSAFLLARKAKGKVRSKAPQQGRA
jgi:hypothetical protein